MVEVRTCSVLEIGAFKEIPALLIEYAQECAIAGLPEPKPDESTYLRLERAGLMHLGVALLHGELVGFIALLVSLNPHYGEKLGVIESFFVASAHRKSGAGLLLKQWAEKTAKDNGAIAMLVSAPMSSRLAKVLERSKDYRETNRVFFRRLDV